MLVSDVIEDFCLVMAINRGIVAVEEARTSGSREP